MKTIRYNIFKIENGFFFKELGFPVSPIAFTFFFAKSQKAPVFGDMTFSQLNHIKANEHSISKHLKILIIPVELKGLYLFEIGQFDFTAPKYAI